MGQVYQVKNFINGKLYFGKTIHSMKERRRRHLFEATHNKGNLFQRAIAKYGPENFEWSVVFESEVEDELFAKERALILEFKSNQSEFGYNLTEGGEGQKGRTAWNKGHTKKTDPRMALISEKVRGNKNSLGRKVSEEMKERLREARKHYVVSEATREKQRAVKGERSWITGKTKNTDPRVAKISKALLGQKKPPKSEEHRRKLSEKHKGIPAWNKGLTGSDSHASKRVQCVETGQVFEGIESSRGFLNRQDVTHISSCCRGKRKTAYGYHWKYA